MDAKNRCREIHSSGFLFLFRQREGFFEGLLDAFRRLLIHEAHDDDRDDREEEAGDELIEGKPGKLFPDENGEAADDDTGVGAFERHAFPVEGEEHSPAEAGTEAGPCVGNDREDIAVRVRAEVDGDAGDEKDRDTADTDQRFFRGVLAEEGLEEVTGDRGGCDEQLRGAGTHDGREDRRPNDARDERHRERLCHQDEDAFCIRILKRGREVCLADDAHGDGEGERQDDPCHGDVCRFFQVFGIRDRHEFDEDMRLSEIAEPPAEGGDHHDGKSAHAGGVREEGEEVGPFFRQDIHGRSGAAQCDGRSDRYIEDGEEHHRSLNEVSQSDGGEAAEEGVEYDDEGTDQKGVEVGQTEDSIEKLAGCNESGGCINDEEKNDEEGADEAQAVLLFFETVRQIVRDGERIIRDLRVVTKACGDEDPVRPCTDDEADACPEGREPVQVRIARQSHQHPAAHIRGFRTHGCQPWSQFAVSKDVRR